MIRYRETLFHDITHTLFLIKINNIGQCLKIKICISYNLVYNFIITSI